MDLFSSANYDSNVDDAKALIQDYTDNISWIEAEKFIIKARNLLRYFDQLYYVHGESPLSDYDYDELFSIVKKIEHAFPNLITANSPTQRIAENLNNDFETVTHTAQMFSLENSYNADDLRDFARKVSENLPIDTAIQFTVEPKFDGSSIALVYEDNNLVRAATRGNGIAGDNITANAKAIKSLPLHSDFISKGIKKIEVRGEVVIDNISFSMLNEERERQNEILKSQGKREQDLFKNARNTAAGALRMKSPKDVADKRLQVILYNIGYADKLPIETHFEGLKLLQDLGFKTGINDIGIYEDIEDVIAHCAKWEQLRDSYPIEIDGMVIKVNSLKQQLLVGYTSHHPKWAIAYKFKARQAKSILERVEFQVGRTGVITPVAKIKPVQLAGVEISSISLHNEDFIRDKDIHHSDTLLIERSGDVIPYVVQALAENRNPQSKPITFPENCPSCGHHLYKSAEESAWRCLSPLCPAQTEESIIHFVSKEAMDISGMGEEIVRKFIRNKIISGIKDIYSLDFDKIRQLEGWKDKSVQNLKDNIEKSKSGAAYRLLVGLGIKHIGTTSAKSLVKHIHKLTDFEDWSLEQYLQLEDVGPKVAQSLYDFFSEKDNINLLNELENLGINITQEKMSLKSNALEGKTFLFTGTLQRVSRDNAKAIVEENGGKYLSGVSANLNYLVAGEKAGSKLSKAQKIPSINIISEDDFFNMLENIEE
jgi:DNA ligase (NAD+)